MKRHLAAGLTGAAVALAALTGCSTGPSDADTGDTPDAASTADADAFPVTIEHALGETTIEEEPKRVATLGWTDQDMVASLGVVPVGATEISWGGNDAGSSDWFDEQVEELGGEAPVRYDDTDGTPIDEVAELAPDLILATNSGITEKEYDKLSKVAPVVAYPEAPYVTDWRTSLQTVGEALGRSDLAEEVRADTEEVIAEGREKHPELEGASLVFSYFTPTDLSMIGLYGPEDPRVLALEEFGLETADIVTESVDQGQFYGTISAERAADVESDVMVTYAETDQDVTTVEEHPLLGRIPAVADGHLYAEVDKQVGLTVTNPSPLSFPHIVEDFLPGVSEALGSR